MRKYKCEYIAKDSNHKTISVITEVDQVLDIIQLADCSKYIKVFEKKLDWQLVYHVSTGKTILNDMHKNAKKECKEQYEYKHQQSDDLVDRIMNSYNACPSRVENQSFFDIVFDSIFGKEDVSKPKMEIIKGSKEWEE